MPERVTPGDDWRAGTPLTVGPLTLLPIVQAVTCAGLRRGGAWCSVTRRAVAVVVRAQGREPARLQAFDTDGRAVPLDWLRQRTPGLDAALVLL